MEQIWESLSVILIPPWTDSLALGCWCVFLGVMGVFFYMKYRRATLGKAIRTLQERDATSEEKAVPIGELGLRKNKLPQDEHLFATVTGEEGERVYLPPDRQKKAEYLLKASGGKGWQTFLVILLAYAVTVAAYYLIPLITDLMEALSNF